MLDLKRGAIGSLLIVLPQISAALSNTTSLSATFNSTIESGTCKSALYDGAGNLSDTLDFGDIYMSDIANMKPVKNFGIALSECQAVAKVMVTAAASSHCSGSGSQGSAFANVGGDAQGIAAELWSGEPTSGVQFVCSQSEGQTFDVASETTIIPMSVRMVPTDVELQAGSFDTTLTLLVTYP